MTAFPTIDLPEIGNINVQSQTHINHNYGTDIAPTSNKFFFHYLKWNKKEHSFPCFAKKIKNKKSAVLCVPLYGCELTKLH